MYCRLFLKEDIRLKRFRIVLNCIFAFALILMLISIVGLEENSTYTKDVFDEDLSDGWTLSNPDGTRSEISAKAHPPTTQHSLSSSASTNTSKVMASSTQEAESIHRSPGYRR